MNHYLLNIQSVTAFGRQMIAHSKELVEAQYCVAKGFEHDAKVNIYHNYIPSINLLFCSY